MNIIIEITRECNLKCEHCLRGEAETKTIQDKDIISLFKTLKEKEIYTLTLSGGEPALRPDKIQTIIDLARTYQIDIQNFYIATNGTIASDAFLKVIMELYLYCSDNENSCVEISNDEFHNMELIEENTKRFSIFSFIQYKYHPSEKTFLSMENYNPYKFPNYSYDYNNFDADWIINQGRGKDWGDKKPFIANINECPEDIEWYLNCNGNLINGCDWSYEEQEEHKICHVTEFHKFLQEGENTCL